MGEISNEKKDSLNFLTNEQIMVIHNFIKSAIVKTLLMTAKELDEERILCSLTVKDKDILDSLTNKQKTVVYALIEFALESENLKTFIDKQKTMIYTLEEDKTRRLYSWHYKNLKAVKDILNSLTDEQRVAMYTQIEIVLNFRTQKMIEDVLDSLTQEQATVVYTLIGTFSERRK